MAAGVSNNTEVKVVISPTTKGFRDALINEGTNPINEIN
jgi:hypothetical protein